MLVVSDTSPLNYLILIDHDDVLPTLFRRVLTTPGVLAELIDPRAPEKTRAWAVAPPSWLEVRTPASLEPSLKLHRGETEAISLALELRAEVTLIDERKGVQAATGLGLFVTGTLGVLMLAHERGMIRLADAFADLRAKTNFRAAEELYSELLRRAKGDALDSSAAT